MTEKQILTKKGTVAQGQILSKIYAVMVRPETDEMHYTVLAREMGIGRKTLSDYLTEEVWDEIRRRRSAKIEDTDILALDKAIYARALGGDLAAARLIYARWDKGSQSSGYNGSVAAQVEAYKTDQYLEMQKRRYQIEIENQKYFINQRQKRIDSYR